MEKIILSRIAQWQRQRDSLAETYGRHTAIVARANAILGSLRLLRDELAHSQLDPRTVSEKLLLREDFLLWPNYWDRCTEIRNVIDEILRPADEPDLFV